MKKQVDKVNHITAPGDEVFEAIHDLMHLYRGQQYRALRESAPDFTHMESKVLGYFSRHPGATVSDLVAHSGRDKGQLARLVGGLRERGLLDGQPDPADRRNLRLAPTARGAAIQALLQQQSQLVSEQAVEGLSAQQRRQLLDLLARVQLNLKNSGA